MIVHAVAIQKVELLDEKKALSLIECMTAVCIVHLLHGGSKLFLVGAFSVHFWP